jgi:hypothetical protein
MIYPSIWMQKTFFQIAEGERRAKIGDYSEHENGWSEVSIRVVAIAHAALQFLYAALAVVPASIITAVHVLLTPSPNGFLTRNGTLFERMFVAVGAVFAGLCAPVLASFVTVCNTHVLREVQSCAVKLPVLCHGFVFSFSLPSITNLPRELPWLERLQNLLSPPVLFTKCRENGLYYRADSDDITTFLQAADQGVFRWRLALPEALRFHMENHISHYDQAFDMSRQDLGQALVDALHTAAVPDAQSCWSIMSRS